jgi:hypothetical protein
MVARMQVLHIRNLPPDATEADIVELCKPHGRIVKTKLNTGSSKTQANQAFVEFENVNVAMKMIYSFVGSADPPKVRQEHLQQLNLKHEQQQQQQQRPARGHQKQRVIYASSCGSGIIVKCCLLLSPGPDLASIQSMLAFALQVRSKTVYLQYSTRSEIGSGNWGGGGGGGGGGDHHQSGNVILIIMDNIQVH